MTIIAAVVVNQAAGLDDFLFIVGHGSDVEGQFLHALGDDIGFNVLHVAVEGFFDVGNIDIVTDFKIRFPFHLEGQHAPVDDIGTIALGRVFLADIGQPPRTRWQLAACSRAEPSPGLTQ